MEKELGLKKAQEALDEALKDIKVHNATDIKIMSEERFHEVLNFLDEHYYPDEVVYKTFNVRLNPELEHLLRESFKENISLIAIDKASNKIIGTLISEIIRKDSYLDSTLIQDARLRKSKAFEYSNLEKVDFFERYNVNEGVYYSILSVDRTMRNKGVGKLLVQTALQLDRKLGLKAALVSCSNMSSKKIFQGFKFDFLFAKPYDTWLVDSLSPFTDTGKDKSEDFYGSFL